MRVRIGCTPAYTCQKSGLYVSFLNICRWVLEVSGSWQRLLSSAQNHMICGYAGLSTPLVFCFSMSEHLLTGTFQIYDHAGRSAVEACRPFEALPPRALHVVPVHRQSTRGCVESICSFTSRGRGSSHAKSGFCVVLFLVLYFCAASIY